MDISAGIILRKNGKAFVCTPGGPFWVGKTSWTFPKGLMEPGESPEKAARREFTEETSQEVPKGTLQYYGLIKQRPSKSVHIFFMDAPETWTGEGSKSNLFQDPVSGEFYPEVVGFTWKSFEEISREGCPKAYLKVFKDVLD